MTARDVSAPEDPGPQPVRVTTGQFCRGLAMALVGGAVLVIMAIATFHEVAGDDFFGMWIGVLVAVSGALGLRGGLRRMTGRMPPPADPDPWKTGWDADGKAHLRRPYPMLHRDGK